MLKKITNNADIYIIYQLEKDKESNF